VKLSEKLETACTPAREGAATRLMKKQAQTPSQKLSMKGRFMNNLRNSQSGLLNQSSGNFQFYQLASLAQEEAEESRRKSMASQMNQSMVIK